MNPTLKRTLLSVLDFPLVRPLFWLATRLTGQQSIWLSFAKNNAERRYINTLPKPPSVLEGPFKGLSYSVVHSVGSVLAPKIIGTYEKELFPVWEAWKTRPYRDILDIGCAEGFYAVGAARIWPTATVHAYDIDRGALRLCQNLAEDNGVASHVQVEGPCSPETLKNFPFRGPTLIISDCEGYEGQLFTAGTLPAMAQADILIEVHTPAGPDFMDRVEAATKATHTARRISTQHRQPGESPYLTNYKPEEQLLIMTEKRGTVLDQGQQWWLVLESKA